jgi:hypothetical protein
MGIETNNKADEALWQKYIAGSNDALTELVEKYNSRLIAF